MRIFEEKAAALDAVLKKRENIKNSILLAGRYYLNYHITNDRKFLPLALDTLITCFNKNHSNISIYFFIIFLYAENGEVEKAEHYLESIYPSKNYFKNNEYESFIACMFLRAFIDIKRGSEKGLKKFRKLFSNEISQEFSARSYLLLGVLELSTDNYDDSFKAFISSYRKGSRQLMLNIFLLKYFRTLRPILDKTIFYNNINWAASQGFDLEGLLAYFENYIIDSPASDIALYKKLYRAYQNPYILKIICKTIFDSKDMSRGALSYFNEAENKLLLESSYYGRYINLAYKYEQTSISSYIIVDYIKNTKMDFNIRAYLYFNLIKDEKLKEITNKHRSNIMQFAAIGIEQGQSSIYFKNIYAYFLVNSKNYSIGENILKGAERVIQGDLFKYELTFSSELVSYVWVCDKLKKDVATYHVESKRADIFCSTGGFNIFCFDKSIKKIINDDVKIKKVITYYDIELYKYFYNKGFADLNLLLAYSNYYISNKNVYVESLNVLKDTIDSPGLSDEVKTNINAMIGNIYNMNNRYGDALLYYLKIDQSNFFPDRHVEPMLLVFLNSGEIEMALNILL
ncbi:MAG: DUF5717 family protein, partial [Clostridiales bacterium]|nr:DUF5717 family protein [Clostridiales bacterium]